METKKLYQLYKVDVEAFDLPLDVFYTYQKESQSAKKATVEKVLMNGHDLTAALSDKFYAQLEMLLDSDSNINRI